MDPLISLARALIDIPSVTGNEGPLARHLTQDLTDRGFNVHLQEVGPDRFNVFAHRGEDVAVVMCTHMDTVAPFIPSSEDEGWVYGRGACDAKGILAAMILAAEGLPPEEARRVGLLFVVGEEVDSLGARRANELSVESAYIIVGEPTENRLATGHKGCMEFVIRSEGTAAHSAYPHMGDSAIDHLLGALERIRSADWGVSTRLGEATVNIGTIAGGVAGNVIPPSAEARVFVRLVGPSGQAEEALNRIVAEDPCLSSEITVRSEPVTCFVPEGFETAVVAFGSDIPHLTGFGRPLLVGPGSIHHAHGDDERIQKRQMAQGVQLYRDVIHHLLETE